MAPMKPFLAFLPAMLAAPVLISPEPLCSCHTSSRVFFARVRDRVRVAMRRVWEYVSLPSLSDRERWMLGDL